MRHVSLHYLGRRLAIALKSEPEDEAESGLSPRPVKRLGRLSHKVALVFEVALALLALGIAPALEEPPRLIVLFSARRTAFPRHA